MPHMLDAILFIREVPRITYEDGLFHVSYSVGKVRAEFVMHPRIFFTAIAEAVEVSRKHKRGSLQSIGAHAATATGSPSK